MWQPSYRRIVRLMFVRSFCRGGFWREMDIEVIAYIRISYNSEYTPCIF